MKSSINNFKRMRGYDVCEIVGYDCHGLPIVNKIEKEYGSIKTLGRDKFNSLCHEYVTQCSESWDPLFRKIGREITGKYMTRDENYMECVRQVFQCLWDKGLVYEGKKVMAYSVGARCPLSNFEASMNYKNITCTSVYAWVQAGEYKLVVWTTTPWTLSFNLAICVNARRKYKVISGYVMALEADVPGVGGEPDYLIEGRDLVGLEYTCDFGVGKVVSDDYVGSEGTGLVHLAPGFGEDDFRICYNNGLVNNSNIGDYCPLDADCRITHGRLEGELATDATNESFIIIASKKHKHRYPFCWRTDTPLMYRAVRSVFVRVTRLKDRMLELMEGVDWYPLSTKKRFMNWLEDARDWSISRTTSYATKIPFKDGRIDLNAEGDSFDCWFESACVPMVLGIETADLVCEGIDQTRGWFYTLLILSTALYDRAPYKTVMCTGMILDGGGRKMSKKLENFSSPESLLDKYGADAMRLYYMASQFSTAGNLKFNEKDLRSMRSKLIPYINALEYWKQHCKRVIHRPGPPRRRDVVGRWIVSCLGTLSRDVCKAMDEYRLDTASRLIVSFIDDLTNWYIKLSRDRICGREGSTIDAANDLGYVLCEFSKIASPFIPFITNNVYREIFGTDPLREIFPIHNIDEEVMCDFSVVKEAVVLARQVRFNEKMKNIPAKSCVIYSTEDISLESKDLLMSCVNCRSLRIEDKFERRIVPDKKKIGSHFRNNAKEVLERISSGDLEGLEGYYSEVSIPSTDIDHPHASSERMLVALDNTYDESVKIQHISEEIHRKVQKMRKEAGLHPWDEITVHISTISPYSLDLLKKTLRCPIVEGIPDGETITSKEIPGGGKVSISYLQREST